MLGRGKDFATEECIFKMVTAEKPNSCYGENDMVIILGEEGGKTIVLPVDSSKFSSLNYRKRLCIAVTSSKNVKPTEIKVKKPLLKVSEDGIHASKNRYISHKTKFSFRDLGKFSLDDITKKPTNDDTALSEKICKGIYNNESNMAQELQCGIKLLPRKWVKNALAKNDNEPIPTPPGTDREINENVEEYNNTAVKYNKLSETKSSGSLEDSGIDKDLDKLKNKNRKIKEIHERNIKKAEEIEKKSLKKKILPLLNKLNICTTKAFESVYEYNNTLQSLKEFLPKEKSEQIYPMTLDTPQGHANLSSNNIDDIVNYAYAKLHQPKIIKKRSKKDLNLSLD